MKCASCGQDVQDVVEFGCPNCGEKIVRCSKCRSLSIKYVCSSCGREGP